MLVVGQGQLPPPQQPPPQHPPPAAPAAPIGPLSPREPTAANVEISLLASVPQPGQRTSPLDADIATSFSNTWVQVGQRYS